MNPKNLQDASIDENGHLALPQEVMEAFQLQPGMRLRVEVGTNEVRLLRPVTHLAKIYVEPTNICNLDCRTCMRNVWEEPYGRMSRATFDRIVGAVGRISPRPTVFFQGFGEPLAHPRIVEMVAAMHALGARVELITNAVLLTEKKILQLTRAGLDGLWVSLDGASPESYADVRLGSSLPTVIHNLERFRTLRHREGYQHDPRPQLGIAFVAMKRNIADLPDVLRLGTRLGARRFSISNLLPHSEELRPDALFDQMIHRSDRLMGATTPVVNLPRIDFDERTQAALSEVLKRKYVLLLAGKEVDRTLDTCQFIEQGSTAIRWDGMVSPCPPLLHSHDSYLDRRLRRTTAHAIGSLHERDLLEIWGDPEYVALRERIQMFDFSPCTSCNCCEMAEANGEDCVNSVQPSCGGCLWGQGLIQCP